MLTSWNDSEITMMFQGKWLLKYCEFDIFLNTLAQDVMVCGIKKLQDAGKNIDHIRAAAAEEEKAW